MYKLLQLVFNIVLLESEDLMHRLHIAVKLGCMHWDGVVKLSVLLVWGTIGSRHFLIFGIQRVHEL